MSSQVLLGIKDDMISEASSTNWKTNKIGGKPDWTPASQDVNAPQCQLCDRKMALAVQVYSPLGTSAYDRTLYVFCCIKPTCWNKKESWQVYRVQYLPPEENVRQVTASPAEDMMWLSEELDWDDDSDDNASQEVLLDKPGFNIANKQSFSAEEAKSICSMDNCNPLTAQVLEMSRAAKDGLPWQLPPTPMVPPDYSPVFTPFFINVIEEPPVDKDVDRHIQQLLDSYQGKELHSEMGSMNTESAAEMYENCVTHGDRTFQKFVNRVARCQQQIIRYCWKGEPLLMRNEPLPLICQHCGGPLVYELQLMPGLVNFLRLYNVENRGTAVEFGTVLIFTCQSSCWEGGEKYQTENICIQSDPEEDLFQQMS